MKYQVTGNVEYVMGHLRYGHYEGILDLTEEEVQKLQQNPHLLRNEDYVDDLEFVIDGWAIDDSGPVYEIFLDPVYEKEEME